MNYKIIVLLCFTFTALGMQDQNVLKQKATLLEKCSLDAQGSITDLAQFLVDLKVLFLANKFEEFFALADLMPSMQPLSLYNVEIDFKRAIHWAAYHGNVSAISELHRRDISIDCRNSVGLTPLHVAALRNRPSAIRCLVKLGADILLATKYQYTALHFAAELGNLEAIECLLELGAHMEVRTMSDVTPLLLTNDPGAYYCLLRRGARGHGYWNGTSSLHHAARMGSVSAIELLVHEKAAPLDWQNDVGSTALHYAAYAGHTDAIKALIKAGANINAQNYKENTPLHDALLNNRFDSVRCLIELGANKKCFNREGYTPLQAFIKDLGVPRLLSRTVDTEEILKSSLFSAEELEMASWAGQKLIHLAAREGLPDVIHQLRELGADIYALDRSGTNACEYDKYDKRRPIIPVILRFEDVCGPNGKREHGNTLLIEAVARGLTGIVRELLADKRLDVDSRNQEGNTALHQAAAAGHVACVRLLLQDNRCNKYIPNDEGNTAFHLAVQNNKPRVAKCFLQFNTNTSVPLNYKRRSVKMTAELLSACREILDLIICHEAENKKGCSVVIDADNSCDNDGNSNDQDPLWLRLKDTQSPNVKRENGSTLLMEAAECGAATIVKRLLKFPGIEINCQDNIGNTALHRAAKKGFVSVVEILLSDDRTQKYLRNKANATAFHLGAVSPDVVASFVRHNTDAMLCSLDSANRTVESLIAESALNQEVYKHQIVLNRILSEAERIKRLPEALRNLIRRYAEKVTIRTRPLECLETELELPESRGF